MAAVVHDWVRSGDDVIHVLDIAGHGRPALFLHGVGGGAWTWEPVADQLAGSLRMISVDLPGYGDSRWREDGDYSSEHAAGALADVVRSITADPADQVDLVGFSWGGLIALTLVARLPAAVGRLVVVDIPPSTPLSDTDIPQLPVTFADLDAAVAASRALAPRATERVLLRDAAHLVRPGPDGGFHRRMDPRLTHRWPFRQDDRWAELAAFGGSMLIVRGGESPVLAAEVAERMADVAGNAQLHTIADCGHLVPLERPAELATLLRDFLRS